LPEDEGRRISFFPFRESYLADKGSTGKISEKNQQSGSLLTASALLSL
jgi:hypothetical protein